MPVVSVGQLTITDVNDGLNLVLSNESHNIPTDAAGNSPVFTGAVSTAKVLAGGTDVTSSWTITAVSSVGVSGTFSNNTYTVTGMTVDVGTVDFTATKPGQADLTARFTLTKSKKGDQGNPGLDGLTIVVSNESHTLPANSSGTVSSYANSGTTIRVYEGSVELNAVSGASSNGSFGIGTTTQLPASTITVGATSYSGKIATIAAHSAMVAGTDSVVITYPITIKRANGTVVSTTKSQTLTKSKQGGTGGPGPTGPRGSVHLYKLITGSVWSDAEANALFASGQPSNPLRVADRVTLYNSSAGFSQTRAWTGSAWQIQTEVLDGNLLVTKSVTSAAINTEDLYAQNVDVTGSMRVGNATNYVRLGGDDYIRAQTGDDVVFLIPKTGRGFVQGRSLVAGSVGPEALSEQTIALLRSELGGLLPEFGGRRTLEHYLVTNNSVRTRVIVSSGNPVSISLNYWGTGLSGIVGSALASYSVSLLRNGVQIFSKVFTGTTTQTEPNVFYKTLPKMEEHFVDNSPGVGDLVYTLNIVFSNTGTYTNFGWLVGNFQQDAEGGRVQARWGDILDKPATATRWPTFSEVTGTAAAAQIPNLDAGKITSGTFAAARIPNLDAGKITTGTFAAARIPTGISITGNAGTVTNGVYTNGSYANPSWLTGLDAGKITSGTIHNDRISGSYTGLVNLTGSGTVDFAKFLGNASDTAAAPSYSWTGDTNTGIWQPGADQIGFATGGTNRLTISATSITSTLPITAPSFLGKVRITEDGDRGPILTFGTLTGGSGYVNGIYTNVALTGGNGAGAIADITVSGGSVTSVVLNREGNRFLVGNTLSASAANLGGTGSGFSIVVASVRDADINVYSTSPRLRLMNPSTGLSAGSELGSILFGGNDSSAGGRGDLARIIAVAEGTSGGGQIQFWTAANGTAPTLCAAFAGNNSFRLFNSTGDFYHTFSNNPTANRTITLPDANVTLVSGTMVPNTITITAGNGLTGGGNLTANRTITLGTPGTISVSTTNSVTSAGHTHALSVTPSEIGAPSTTGVGASGTWDISVSGNAGTVTNGVYTNGSYANPTWITSLAASKLTGTVANAQISGSYTGLTNLTGSGNVDFAKFLGNASDTATAPSYSWTGDTNTGIWQPGADQIGFSTGGTNRLTISTSEAVFGVPIVVNRSLDLSMGSNTRPNGLYVSDLGSTVGEVGNPTLTAAITAQTNTARGISLTVDSTGYLYGMRMHTSAGVTGFQSKVRSADKWTSATNLTIGNSQKAVDGSTNVAWSLAEIGAVGRNGSQSITKDAHAHNAAAFHLELFSPDNGSSDEVSLRMHQGSRFYGQIRLRNDGFHFTQGNTGDYRNIYFATATGNLNGNATSVTNGVYTTGNQSISGVKTFASEVRSNTGLRLQNAGYNHIDLNTERTSGNTGGIRFWSLGTKQGELAFKVGGEIRAEAGGFFNASDLGSGTVPDARISGSYTGLVNLTGSGTVDFAKFLGNTSDTVTAPSYSWTGDLNTGMYRIGAANIGFTGGGSLIGRLNGNGFSANTLMVMNTSATTGNGISLYGAQPATGMAVYGISFTGTGSFGKHGSVTGDWATYFTMNDTPNRGWIFKAANTGTGSCVASISNSGNAHFNGTVTAGSQFLGVSVGSSWINGHRAGTEAAIRITNVGSVSSFHSWISQRTPNGGWAQGVLGDSLYFNWAGNANIDGSVNQTNQTLRLESSGRVVVSNQIVDINGVKFMKWSDFTPNMFLTQQFMDENNLNLAQYDVIQASFIAAGVLGANLIATNGFNVVSAPNDPVQRKFTLYPGIANGKIAQGKLFHFRTVNAAGDDDEDLFYIDTQGEGYFKGSLARGNVDSKAISESAKRAINPYYTGDPDAAVWAGNQLVGSGGATTGVVSIGNANQTPVRPDERVTIVFEIKDSYGEMSIDRPGWQPYTNSTYTITLQRRVGTGSWVNVPGQSTTYNVLAYNTEPYLVEDRDGRESWEGDYSRGYGYNRRIEFVDEGSLTGRTTELQNVQYRLFVNRTVTGIGTSGGLRFRLIEAEKDAFIKNTLQETGVGGGSDLSSILFIDKESGYATYTTQVRRTGYGTIVVTFPKAFKTVHGCTLGYSRGNETGHRYPPRYSGLTRIGVTVNIVDGDTSQLNTVTVTVTGTMER